MSYDAKLEKTLQQLSFLNMFTDRNQVYTVYTLESVIDVGQGISVGPWINVGPWKFGKKNNCRAGKIWQKE